MSKEVWREVNGFCGSYMVSDRGRVKSVDRMVRHKCGGQRLSKGKILNHRISTHGYVILVLYMNGIRTNHSVHRLVANAFIPNPENKPQVNHKNGIKTDNRVENLEWVTCSENILHGIKTGLKSFHYGESNRASVLTNENVFEIRMMLKNKIPMASIAKMFGVSSSAIGQIKHGITWKHI